jgi:hypothetical protein
MRRSFVAMVLAASLINAPSGLFDPLWTFLSPLWGGSADTKIGCEWDPNGQCLPAPQPTSEIGCEWDPSGRCIPGS